MSNSYVVNILLEGYYTQVENGMLSNCTCTLIQSAEKRMIIDTRTSWDGDEIIAALKRYKLRPEDIQHCISTHGHSNHCGCNYLFKNALHFVGKSCISKRDIFYDHNFDEPFVIDGTVRIISTPGHTEDSISVLVNTKDGIIAIVGDLFVNEKDLWDEYIWRMRSQFPEIHIESREKILEIADFIIPGHGTIFINPYKMQDFEPE